MAGSAHGHALDQILSPSGSGRRARFFILTLARVILYRVVIRLIILSKNWPYAIAE
jgi:hypothetical protein